MYFLIRANERIMLNNSFTLQKINIFIKSFKKFTRSLSVKSSVFIVIERICYTIKTFDDE